MQVLDDWSHLDEHGTSDDHHIGLSQRATDHRFRGFASCPVQVLLP
jgi:hypothetical protein